MEIKPVDADADAGDWICLDYIVGDKSFDAPGFHSGGGGHPVRGCLVHGDFRGLCDRTRRA